MFEFRKGFFVASIPLRRQILILVDKPTIRNLLFLMKKLETENAADGSASAVAALTEAGQPGTVVLDLRCQESRSRDEIHGIRKVQASRLGKILMITVETNGPKTMSIVERYLSSGLPGTLLWLVSHRYQSRRS